MDLNDVQSDYAVTIMIIAKNACAAFQRPILKAIQEGRLVGSLKSLEKDISRLGLCL